MKFNILRFEEICPDYSEVPSGAPDSLIEWTRAFTNEIDFFSVIPHSDAVPEDLHQEPGEMDVIFISRSDFEDIFPQLSMSRMSSRRLCLAPQNLIFEKGRLWRPFEYGSLLGCSKNQPPRGAICHFTCQSPLPYLAND